MEPHTLKCCSRKKHKEKSEMSEKSNELVPFLKLLFRFASNTDTMLLVLSVSACLIHGVCIPIMMILFGDLAKVLVDSTNQGRQDFDFVNRTQCQYYWSSNSTTIVIK